MLQYATAQAGAILVNINPAYRADELEYALNKSSMCTVFAAQEFKSSDYVSMLENVRGRCPALSDVIIVGWEPWQELADTAVDEDALARVRSGLKPSDPINIQYTSGTTGFPQGRHADSHQHSQQRLSRRRGPALHGEGPGLHSGALLPLLRNGAGKPGVYDPRCRDGDSGARLRTGGDAESRCGGTVHIAIRGADDVHRRAGAAELRQLRPEQPAHRDHGRIDVSQSR